MGKADTTMAKSSTGATPLKVLNRLTVQASAWKKCVAVWLWVKKIRWVLITSSILAEQTASATPKPNQSTAKKWLSPCPP